ncbi:sugar ABC transporter permease, partial [Nesterenkonia sp. HG001]|nr:sugar ABC transporter permease [Nesterenkonia sp. HG001]
MTVIGQTEGDTSASTRGSGAAPPPKRSAPSAPGGRTGTRATHTWRYALKKDWRLYSLLVLPLVFLLIFRYLPMAGNVIAFRRFR